MSFTLVQSTAVSSAVSTVTLTGINTDDVYICAWNNVFCDANDDVSIRVTTSGTGDSDSEYDYASKDLKEGASYGNTNNRTNKTHFDLSAGIGTSGTNSDNGIMYLFNFNDSSEYSFVTYENVTFRDDSADTLFGFQGGGVHTVAEANDGIHFFLDGGNNFVSGTFSLYKVI